MDQAPAEVLRVVGMLPEEILKGIRAYYACALPSKEYSQRVEVWRRNHETAFTGTKSEAKVAEAQLRIAAEARGPVASRIAPKFSTFLMGRYALYAGKHENKNTKRNRKNQYALLDQYFGGMRLDRITRRDIENFQTWRQEGNPVRDLAPVKIGTDENGQAITRPYIVKPVGAPKINYDCKVLSIILNYAKELDLRSNVPKAKALPEIAKNDRVQVWTAGEVDDLFVALSETARNLLPMTICLLNTGMRKGEVIAMPWDWIDLIAGMIRIQPNEYWQPKNGKPRDVPIADVLQRWLEVPVDERPRDKDGRPSRHVFPS